MRDEINSSKPMTNKGENKSYFRSDEHNNINNNTSKETTFLATAIACSLAERIFTATGFFIETEEEALGRGGNCSSPCCFFDAAAGAAPFLAREEAEVEFFPLCGG